MYDFGARMYMPDLGRFSVIDPMADFVNYQSPYVVSDNNPVFNVDEYGLGILNVLGNILRRIGNGIKQIVNGKDCSCVVKEDSIERSWMEPDFPNSGGGSGSGRKPNLSMVKYLLHQLIGNIYTHKIYPQQD